MRQQYISNQDTYNSYHSALNNDYGYIYNVQSGGGIGGFLKKVFNFIKPIGKSLLHKGLEAAKPELSKLANRGAEEATKYAVKQIGKAHIAVQKKLNKKRKADSLS